MPLSRGFPIKGVRRLGGGSTREGSDQKSIASSSSSSSSLDGVFFHLSFPPRKYRGVDSSSSFDPSVSGGSSARRELRMGIMAPMARLVL